jgi:hypothetical protein
MAQAGLSFTRVFRNQFCSAGSTLLLFVQKTLFAFLRMISWSHCSFFQPDQICKGSLKLLLHTLLPLHPANRSCPRLRHPRRLRNKARGQTFHFCRPGLAADLSNRWVLETSSSIWLSPRSALVASSRTVLAPGYAWQILPAATRMSGALELRHLDATTETVLPALELKALGASPLLFSCTKILVIGGLKAPSFLHVRVAPWSLLLSIERTVATARLPSQTSPGPQLPVLLATHISRPASIT